MTAPALFIDMDGVLADFHKSHYAEGSCKFEPGFFLRLHPIPGAIPAVKQLAKAYPDLYILSAPMWDNPLSAHEKIAWIKMYFGDLFKHRIILANHKFRVGTAQDILVDDWLGHGNSDFCGEFVHFGSEKYPSWPVVTQYLLTKRENW